MVTWGPEWGRRPCKTRTDFFYAELTCSHFSLLFLQAVSHFYLLVAAGKVAGKETFAVDDAEVKQSQPARGNNSFKSTGTDFLIEEQFPDLQMKMSRQGTSPSPDEGHSCAGLESCAIMARLHG